MRDSFFKPCQAAGKVDLDLLSTCSRDGVQFFTDRFLEVLNETPSADRPLFLCALESTAAALRTMFEPECCDAADSIRELIATVGWHGPHVTDKN